MNDRRVMLVPNQLGSVEHCYHFLLGYLCPIVLWLERHPRTPVTVRDCGPMTPWLDLIRLWADIDVIAPGTMLQRVVGRHQPMSVLPRLDDPSLFDGGAFRACPTRVRSGLDGELRHAAGGIVVTDRGPADPFYASSVSEIPTAGSGRRSVPNIADVARALESVGPVRLLDAATLNPQSQVEAFTSTMTLVGQHGAGLANMVWMAPGATVIEIMPPMGSWAERLFAALADSLGMGYARVTQDGSDSPVRIADVRAAIAAASSPRVMTRGEQLRRRGSRVKASAKLRVRRWPAVSRLAGALRRS